MNSATQLYQIFNTPRIPNASLSSRMTNPSDHRIIRRLMPSTKQTFRKHPTQIRCPRHTINGITPQNLHILPPTKAKVAIQRIPIVNPPLQPVLRPISRPQPIRLTTQNCQLSHLPRLLPPTIMTQHNITIEMILIRKRLVSHITLAFKPLISTYLLLTTIIAIRQ